MRSLAIALTLPLLMGTVACTAPQPVAVASAVPIPPPPPAPSFSRDRAVALLHSRGFDAPSDLQMVGDYWQGRARRGGRVYTVCVLYNGAVLTFPTRG